MSREFELKFRAATRDLSALGNSRIAGAHSGERSQQQLVSIYFDTKKHKLKRRGVTLRVRRVGANYTQTVKAAATDSFGRGEWECKLEKPAPDLDKANDTPLAKLNGKKLRRNLRPIFSTSVRRITRPVQIGPSKIELAIDSGKIRAKRHSVPIAEFELELKDGRMADLFRVAKTLERKVGAQLELQSKAERGYLVLIGGSKRAAAHAEPIYLNRTLTSDEAFKVIAHSTLRHFSTNADGVRALDAEAVHQMRVGLRRMRAAISLFKKILPEASTDRIKVELKWLTNQLAPARETDVFLKERVRPILPKSNPKRGARAIESEFTAKRNATFRDARQVVETPRFRRLLIKVLEWLETRRTVINEAQTPIDEFAAEVLDRLIKKARKKGRHLDELSPGQRHKLRIKVKKIRYGLEFFKSLYADQDREQLAKLGARLKKIQDSLGALNDAIAHEKMAKQAALTAPRRNRRSRAFISGVIVGQESGAANGIIRAAEKEMRKVRPLT